MFNAFLEPCCPRGIGTNGNRVVAAVVLSGTIPLGIAESHRLFNPAQQVARLSCGYQDNADHNAAVNILARNEPLDANVSGVTLCVV
jgi:hypothetical protein